MPFSLINNSATYQRMVTKLFTGMISVTIESYVDDMLVKFVNDVNHTKDLKKAFEQLRHH